MQEKSSIKKFQDLFSNAEGKHDLAYVLSIASPEMSYEQKIEWFSMVRIWIVAPVNGVRTEHKSPHTRIRFILQLLERHPDWAKNVSLVIREMFESCRAFSCFAYLGLFEEKGFADQIASLMIDHILPLPKPPEELSEWLETIFPSREDAEWIETLPIELLQEFFCIVRQHTGEKSLFESVLKDMIAAMQVLAVQVSSMGSTPSLWTRLGCPDLQQLPFWKLERTIADMSQKLLASNGFDWKDIELDTVFVHLKACEVAMNQAFEYLQTHGVNTGLVLRLEHILMHLRRLGFICRQLESIKENCRGEQGLLLLAELIRARYDATNFRQLLKGNLQMLSLRVVEHTGTSGEHYITRTRAEYLSMLKSASGGGVLTVGTTMLKYGIGKLALPPFIEAFFQFGNYAGSFLAMQGLHFTLATKQPSMTAAALATKIKMSKGSTNNLAIAFEIRHIVRSQFAAVLGNIGLAVPTALLFSYAFARIKGQPFYDLDYAKHAIESLHPIRTLSLFYAAQTGLLLWMSSLVAGWFENWLAYQRVPNRLEKNARIKRAFGPESGKKISTFLSQNISGITGNVVLGFFLATLPFLGKITGLPLDIRHVTLSSASLAIAAVSMGSAAVPTEIVMASLGVLGIGFLNFTVSFYMALMVARYAQNINDRTFLSIKSRVLQLFKWKPLAFFFPTKGAEENEKDTIDPSQVR
ncbi:MAG: hypothetical protein H7249_19860 [Chitinophagaceae bacterium]|nr:hypothetical protein [Oligoflexus sp.]